MTIEQPASEKDLYGLLTPEVTNHVVKMHPSGIYFPLLEPDLKLIHIEDIAHHLARICRYNGGWIDFCSVAAHSVKVWQALEGRGTSTVVQMWGLLHDASEAYCGDMVNPLKRCGRLDAYIEIEDAVQQSIATAFDLPWPMPEIVHLVDQEVGAWEREHRKIGTRELYLIDHHTISSFPTSHDYAANRFLGAYEYLRTKREREAA